MDVKSEAWERAVHEIAPQSEKLDRALVVSSFVDMGHLNRLTNQTSQYIQGRRGTGKTHLLTYFADVVNGEFREKRAVAVLVDARTLRIESAEADTPPKHLAKELYRELIISIAQQLERFSKSHLWQNDVPTPRSPFEQRQAEQTRECLLALFALIDTGVARPAKPAVVAAKSTESERTKAAASAEVEIDPPAGRAAAKARASVEGERVKAREVEATAAFEMRISFAEIGAKIEEYLGTNDLARCYVVIDEWSSIPRDAQPYFAEYLKRTFFPSATIALKIGTLPLLTRFTASDGNAPIGFERNGDIFLGLDLDDDLVFVKNGERSANISSRVLHNHLKYALEKMGVDLAAESRSPADTIEQLFTEDAFPRLLAYSQGNARDFLTLFRKAYLLFKDSASPRITVPHVDDAAKSFAIEKLDGIKENSRAYEAFNSIVTDILHTQKSNGFLVDVEFAADDTLLFLIHNRVLHVWDKSYSSPSHAGKRFVVLSIDFCIISEHLKSPTYRHIWEELELPLTDASKKKLEKAKKDRERVGKLGALEAPDKRMVRYKVLSEEFFQQRARAICAKCGATNPRAHPVIAKLNACPSCGEPLAG